MGYSGGATQQLQYVFNNQHHSQAVYKPKANHLLLVSLAITVHCYGMPEMGAHSWSLAACVVSGDWKFSCEKGKYFTLSTVKLWKGVLMIANRDWKQTIKPFETCHDDITITASWLNSSVHSIHMDGERCPRQQPRVCISQKILVTIHSFIYGEAS